ncbi:MULTISPECIES: TetR/AcrR family transcriptional regulator [Anaerostipes]|uniref:TetR/AcrR family transcriptional regulator n=1 Tax=Anaerostipes TaxID=207244 RepID=UPI00257CA3B2|nr:TetR-like C-terminal domain-containing protein [Anaerostipes sp.]
MKEIKTDRRVRRTQNALKTNLLLLMKEQPIQKISVSRLCEKSDINRSTFYTYYSSPMDLLREIEKEILLALDENVEQYNINNSLTDFMDSLIHYISSHKDLIRLVFSDHGDPAFLNQLNQRVQENNIANWEQQYPEFKKEDLEFCYIFISRGCIGIIQQWIRNGFQQSEKEISHLLKSLSFSAASDFLKSGKL